MHESIQVALQQRLIESLQDYRNRAMTHIEGGLYAFLYVLE